VPSTAACVSVLQTLDRGSQRQVARVLDVTAGGGGAGTIGRFAGKEALCFTPHAAVLRHSAPSHCDRSALLHAALCYCISAVVARGRLRPVALGTRGEMHTVGCTAVLCLVFAVRGAHTSVPC
jgi:hypothetical protein